jgi:hypothetical protein
LVRRMAETRHVSQFPVLRHMHGDFHFPSLYFPSASTYWARNWRKSHSDVPVKWFHFGNRKAGWLASFVTRDEPWSFLSHSPHGIWNMTWDDIDTRPNHDIRATKSPFTLIRNWSRFHVMNKLAIKEKLFSPQFIVFDNQRKTKRYSEGWRGSFLLFIASLSSEYSRHELHKILSIPIDRIKDVTRDDGA